MTGVWETNLHPGRCTPLAFAVALDIDILLCSGTNGESTVKQQLREGRAQSKQPGNHAQIKGPTDDINGR